MTLAMVNPKSKELHITLESLEREKLKLKKIYNCGIKKANIAAM